jgi:hypothetical protein
MASNRYIVTRFWDTVLMCYIIWKFTEYILYRCSNKSFEQNKQRYIVQAIIFVNIISYKIMAKKTSNKLGGAKNLDMEP